MNERVWATTKTSVIFHAFNEEGVALCRKNLRSRWYVGSDNDFKTLTEIRDRFTCHDTCAGCVKKFDDLRVQEVAEANAEKELKETDTLVDPWTWIRRPDATTIAFLRQYDKSRENAGATFNSSL